MPRPICSTCLRPLKVCLCKMIRPVTNRVEIAILQHPSEVDQIKGTARIAQLSLSKVRTWVGEDFSAEASFQAWLNQGEVFLLYPESESIVPVQSHSIESIRLRSHLDSVKVLVIDGTWRKAHKIMMTNPQLQGLPRIVLQPSQTSSYQIRKQKNSLSLSTIEAIYEVLAQLEADALSFKPLLESFTQMVNQQLAFRPANTIDKDGET